MSDSQNSPTLFTRWVMRRNAILGSARFQRWASRTPFFRTIARRRAAAQFDLVAGFVYSQILSACVTLGLIEFLGGALRTEQEVAAHVRLGPEATKRLLGAAAALDLCESPQPGLWTLGEAGAPLSANPGALAMIRHHALLYRDLADPVALLRQDRATETALSSFWSYASKAGAEGSEADYSALMVATQPMVVQQIIDAYPFGRHRRMLDIGGGSAGFTLAVAAVAPELEFGIFDLPPVIAEAQMRLSAGQRPHAPALYGGSFKTDALPGGYDLVTLVRILHDHDDQVVDSLLARIHAALPPHGQLLIVEPLADAPSAGRMGDAYFGLYLWAMGSGRPRTQAVLRQMLANAGFSSVRTVPTALPIITSALVASK
jgi:demethylspheroidene O-methyltransferase